ncbi:gram-negative bacteria-binding protein 2 [Drosophila virilis]|nr:gram-negative bacteria-binding protein 2 isoform X2 [Drosophila virilis]
MFFSTEISDECTSDYIYVHSANNSNTFSIRLEKEPKINDIIRIFSVIETKDQVISKTYDLRINADGHGTNEQKCIREESDSNSNRGCSGRLIFEENFKDNKLTHWTHAVCSRVHTYHKEFAAFLKSDNNCYIEDEKLHFNATLTNYKLGDKFTLPSCTYTQAESRNFLCGPYTFAISQPLPPMHSAILYNRNLRFNYGRIEIRAKMPIGDWLFPYLILYPINRDFESINVFEPHIRMAYVRGNPHLHDYAHQDIGGNMLFGSVFGQIGDDYHEATVNMPHKSGSHYGDHFHDYTLIRHKDRIIFKVDGVTFGTIKDKKTIESLKGTEYYIVLGLTAGGILNFKEEYVNLEKNFLVTPQAPSIFLENISIDPSTWKHPKLVIDHVRVYTTHPDEN